MFLPIVAWIGVGLFIIGGLCFLFAAFRAGFLWGLGCLILPLVFDPGFLLFHWREAKAPFLLQVIGLVIAFTATAMYQNAV